ncbi:hypothetical protein ACFU53_08230 [Streptomyces sp. NPDC057474]|uniref:5'-methylthioadenosine/S-adenosylhomocysteine nucleosidase family protein n=1 Tax=Streptomyces sp. NPDC057474 TaxID=3346144 RepID=UPI00369A9E87
MPSVRSTPGAPESPPHGHRESTARRRNVCRCGAGSRTSLADRARPYGQGCTQRGHRHHAGNDWFRPRAAFFVGIAGSLREDLEVGDVVVASRVYAIHGGKLRDGRFDVRPASWPVSHRLEQAAGKALEDTAEFEPSAVGDVVLDDDKAELVEFLRHHCQDAVAIETEGTGSPTPHM